MSEPGGGEARPILCGQCHVAVEGRVETDGREMVRCLTCGQEDTLDNAVREASEYVADKAIREMIGGISPTSSRHLKVTVTGPADRSYRFIIE